MTASPDLAIIVPCRLESTRFPRKLLHLIKGKPLLLWVAERIREQVPALPLWFAVDDERLRDCVAAAGFRTVMTDAGHASGTDRLAEANAQIGAARVINVQADEPLMSAGQIEALAGLLAAGAQMATLVTPFRREEDFLDPNQVKVVLRRDGRALYFSRSPIPHERAAAGGARSLFPASANGLLHPSGTEEAAGVPLVGARSGASRALSRPEIPVALRHLGLYGYTAGMLAKIGRLPRGRYEDLEKLEQLRVLESGYDIHCALTEEPSIGIDTPEDAAAFERTVFDRGP
ncbi:3-deoxy-manno-octulosonate cytidylyltransferase [Cephaloticoccus primus]|uniref:3-deoxy-manno-octulosonate cytidylyltransferase n=1 Tax=Cephaloticoccus primus TaxID=1548207 RepID=A0A139SRK4_9BACT|nr:3-deoxy-manno-octulosonate cytidylyltransferase [Cephaloticoccus primus]KXU37188.1 3-deoxy-manno-octulosonate cytidylyltransferase [Cephaloticoccus primus]